MRYFNAFFYHDLMNKDPEKRKKIKGIIFEIGYSCRRYLECPHSNECRYKSSYKYYNMSIKVRRWIFDHFYVDIKVPWYFQKQRVDFSGTTKCPYEVPRIYTCYECSHLGFVPSADLGLGCTSKDYINAPTWKDTHDEDTPPGRCKFFDLDLMYANYDKRTGEIIRGY